MSTALTYDGKFRNNLRDGIGTQRFKDGAEYVGEWKADHRLGHGTYVTADKSWTYDGDWANDLRNGEGKLTSNDGSYTYEGAVQERQARRSGHGDVRRRPRLHRAVRQRPADRTGHADLPRRPQDHRRLQGSSSARDGDRDRAGCNLRRTMGRRRAERQGRRHLCDRREVRRHVPERQAQWRRHRDLCRRHAPAMQLRERCSPGQLQQGHGRRKIDRVPSGRRRNNRQRN